MNLPTLCLGRRLFPLFVSTSVLTLAACDKKKSADTASVVPVSPTPVPVKALDDQQLSTDLADLTAIESAFPKSFILHSAPNNPSHWEIGFGEFFSKEPLLPDAISDAVNAQNSFTNYLAKVSVLKNHLKLASNDQRKSVIAHDPTCLDAVEQKKQVVQDLLQFVAFRFTYEKVLSTQNRLNCLQNIHDPEAKMDPVIFIGRQTLDLVATADAYRQLLALKDQNVHTKSFTERYRLDERSQTITKLLAFSSVAALPSTKKLRERLRNLAATGLHLDSFSDSVNYRIGYGAPLLHIDESELDLNEMRRLGPEEIGQIVLWIRDLQDCVSLFDAYRQIPEVAQLDSNVGIIKGYRDEIGLEWMRASEAILPLQAKLISSDLLEYRYGLQSMGVEFSFDSKSNVDVIQPPVVCSYMEISKRSQYLENLIHLEQDLEKMKLLLASPHKAFRGQPYGAESALRAVRAAIADCPN